MRAFLLLLALASCASKPSDPKPEDLQKHLDAQKNLREGLEFLFSKDPQKKNATKALEKFRIAAELGDPMAMDQIGGLYSAGLAGLEKNCEQELFWYGKSAELGYPLAMNNLAYTLITCKEQKFRDLDRAESILLALFTENPGFIALLDTYSSLLAQQGNFKQAAKTMDVVVDLAEFVKSNPERIDEFKHALALYKKNKNLDALTEPSKLKSQKAN